MNAKILPFFNRDFRVDAPLPGDALLVRQVGPFNIYSSHSAGALYLETADYHPGVLMLSRDDLLIMAETAGTVRSSDLPLPVREEKAPDQIGSGNKQEAETVTPQIAEADSPTWPDLPEAPEVKVIVYVEMDKNTREHYICEIQKAFGSVVSIIPFRRADDAHAFLRENSDRVNLILSALLIEDYSGTKFLRDCKVLYPTKPFMILSGYDYRRNPAAHGCDRYVLKTPHTAELIIAIYELAFTGRDRVSA